MRFRGHERAEGLFSPMLDVEFRFADDPRIYLSVVDSGADYTMIPAEFLPPSISYDDLPDPMVGFGVGCEFEFKACAVEAWFQKWKFSNQVFVIAPKLMKEPTALLGRLDFLARFTVWFDWSEEPGLVDVKPIDKKGKH